MSDRTIALALALVPFASIGLARFAFGLVFVPLGLGMGTWSVFGVMFREHFPSGLRATASSGLYNLARGVQGVAQPAIGVSIAATGSLTTALWFGASATLGFPCSSRSCLDAWPPSSLSCCPHTTAITTAIATAPAPALGRRARLSRGFEWRC